MAAEYAGLSSSQEWNTGPLTAFINAIAKIVKTAQPSAMAVAWDIGPSLRRTRLHPGYKANRAKPMPMREQEDVQAQSFGGARLFLKCAGIPSVSEFEYEADDVIAAHWQQARSQDREVLIVSGDKDFFQLLDPGVTQWRPAGRGEYEVWDAGRVQAVHGCEPRHIPSLMALMGDAGDGVPGVVGIGPVKASKGLQGAGWDLEAVEVLKDPLRRSQALLSLALVDLRNPSYHPEVTPLQPLVLAVPTGDSDLEVMLESLSMKSILGRFQSGTLWSAPTT